MAEEEQKPNSAGLLKVFLTGAIISPVRFITEVSGKVAYIGYHNILKLLYLALGLNALMILLHIRRVLSLKLAVYLYGIVPLMSMIVSFIFLSAIIYIHSTKGLYVSKEYLTIASETDTVEYSKPDQVLMETESIIPEEVSVPDKSFEDLLDDSTVIQNKALEEARKSIEDIMASQPNRNSNGGGIKIGDFLSSQPNQTVGEELFVTGESVYEDLTEEDDSAEDLDISLTQEEERLVGLHSASVEEAMVLLKKAVENINVKSNNMPEKKSNSLFDDVNMRF